MTTDQPLDVCCSISANPVDVLPTAQQSPALTQVTASNAPSSGPSNKGVGTVSSKDEAVAGGGAWPRPPLTTHDTTPRITTKAARENALRALFDIVVFTEPLTQERAAAMLD